MQYIPIIGLCGLLNNWGISGLIIAVKSGMALFHCSTHM